MAAQRNIFDTVVNVDDSNPEWRLELQNGWRITFPPSVSHKPFHLDDNVLIGFENWGNGQGFAYLCLFRGKRLMKHFIFGEECKVENPEDEALYDGTLMKIVLCGEDSISVCHKQNEEIGLTINPREVDQAEKIGLRVGPSLDTMMLVADSSFEGPKILFIKEDY